MFPTKQDTGGLSVPLVSFTGRAPYCKQTFGITAKSKKGISPVDFSTGEIPLDFQLLTLRPKAGAAILSEDRQSLALSSRSCPKEWTVP